MCAAVDAWQVWAQYGVSHTCVTHVVPSELSSGMPGWVSWNHGKEYRASRYAFEGVPGTEECETPCTSSDRLSPADEGLFMLAVSGRVVSVQHGSERSVLCQLGGACLVSWARRAWRSLTEAQHCLAHGGTDQ
jgi:hypothetical protein